MVADIKQVIEDIKKLSADERALIAHCLISSLETKQDENVEEAWSDLAKKRFAELPSGKVKPGSWDEIKAKVKSYDAHATFSSRYRIGSKSLVRLVPGTSSRLGRRLYK
jgi:putative addiction module component (TIGR02574 family)